MNRRLAWRALWVCCLLLSLNRLATAQQLNVTMLGYNPESNRASLRIVVQESEGRPTAVRLVAESEGNELALGDIELAAGERRVMMIGVPNMERSSIDVTALDLRTGMSASNSAYPSSPRLYLSIGDPRNTLNTIEKEVFSSITLELTSSASAGMSMMPGGSMMPPGGSRTTVFWKHGQLDAAEVQNLLTEMDPADGLPDNWLVLAPFRVVFLRDDVHRTLPESARRALDDYTAAGGNVVVWAAEQARTDHRGLGTVYFMPGDPLRQPSYRPAWDREAEPWGKLNAALFPSPEGETKPPRGGLLIAALFFVLAGPVNYFVFSRHGKIRRLLISTPLISLACCLLILAWFLVTRGFSKQGGSYAVTLLDETADQALTLSCHRLESGLYPFGGFHFASKAVLTIPGDEQRYSYGRYSRRSAYHMDMGPEQHITSGLFLPRIGLDYNTLLPWNTREHLVVDERALTVTNGFEQSLRGGLVSVPQDGTFVLYRFGSLERGAQARLEIVPPRGGQSIVMHANTDDAIEALGLEHRSTYTAQGLVSGLWSPSQGEATAPRPYYIVRLGQPTPEVQAGIAFDRQAEFEHVLIGMRPLPDSPAPAQPPAAAATR